MAGIPTMTLSHSGRTVQVCSTCHARPPVRGDDECEVCIMLASYAPPEDLDCPICGARGFEPCNTAAHVRSMFTPITTRS